MNKLKNFSIEMAEMLKKEMLRTYNSGNQIWMIIILVDSNSTRITLKLSMNERRKKTKETSRKIKRNIGKHYSMIKRNYCKTKRLVNWARVRESARWSIARFKTIRINQVIRTRISMENSSKKGNQLQKVKETQMKLQSKSSRKLQDQRIIQG